MTIRQQLTTVSWRRVGLITAGALVTILLLGHALDVRRSAQADGELRVLDQQLRASQQQHHTLALAAIHARHVADSSKQVADSLERAAERSEAKARRLAAQVRTIDSTHLAVELTPHHDTTIVVPAIVTATLGQLKQTILDKDVTLAAKDRELAAREGEADTLRQLVHTDSTTIKTLTRERDDYKAKIPRFGFKAGAVVGVLGSLLVAAALHIL